MVETVEIKLYNSLSRKKEIFQPVRPGKIGLYACGVTVYDECHLGHALQAIVFDVVRRYLEFRGFDVRYVRNYTDVDDKIILRAKERGLSPLALSASLIEREAKDMAGLGIMPPTEAPKVSEYIPQIIRFIGRLVERGAAYTTPRGNVYYRVRSKPDYGKLSGRKVDELLAGVRKEIEDDKEEPLDFALWKSEDVEGAAWDSPFGRGRPGWHIECSVMSHELLGEPFDIHGGGLDLIFPHHENEIAQSESYCGRKHVNYWVHNGLLTVNKEKMSKSLGNFFTIADGLQKFGAELIRFALLQYHYRSNSDFNPQLMATNATRLAGIYEHLLRLEEKRVELGEPRLTERTETRAAVFDPVRERVEQLEAQFVRAMDDDFGTPEAIVALVEAVKLIDECLRRKKAPEIERQRTAAAVWSRFQPLAGVLGILQQDPALFFAELRARFLAASPLDEATIAARMAERAEARARKDYAASDQARDALLAEGVELRDGPSGTEWMVSKEGLERLYS
ncbi:MAG: cysteine--tRNA ligase [Planctomycetota bacterium]